CVWVSAGWQQVEILPVELPLIFGRGEDDEADQPLVVEERDRGPRAGVIEQPLRHRKRLVVGTGPSSAQSGQFHNPAALLQRGPEVARVVECFSTGGGAGSIRCAREPDCAARG